MALSGRGGRKSSKKRFSEKKGFAGEVFTKTLNYPIIKLHHEGGILCGKYNFVVSAALATSYTCLGGSKKPSQKKNGKPGRPAQRRGPRYGHEFNIMQPYAQNQKTSPLLSKDRTFLEVPDREVRGESPGGTCCILKNIWEPIKGGPSGGDLKGDRENQGPAIEKENNQNFSRGKKGLQPPPPVQKEGAGTSK